MLSSQTSKLLLLLFQIDSQQLVLSMLCSDLIFQEFAILLQILCLIFPHIYSQAVSYPWRTCTADKTCPDWLLHCGTSSKSVKDGSIFSHVFDLLPGHPPCLLRNLVLSAPSSCGSRGISECLLCRPWGSLFRVFRARVPFFGRLLRYTLEFLRRALRWFQVSVLHFVAAPSWAASCAWRATWSWN